MPPPQRAKPAPKSARCGIGGGSPRLHTPHPQPVGSRPRPHAPRMGGRAWESTKPQTPHTQARGAPPPGTLMPPRSAQSELPRARAVGLVADPHAHTARVHSQWVAGPGRTPQGRAVERGGAPNPRQPTPMQEAPPPGHRRAAPQHAKPARKSASCGVGEGSRRPHPPHSQPLGSGPRPNAPRTGGRARESAQPWTPYTQVRDAPPQGAVVPPPSRAKSARKSPRCGVGDGSPRPSPPAPTASG